MRLRTTIALALLVTLAGCTGTDEPAPEQATPEPSTSAAEPTSESPTGGTIDAPTVVEPTSALLDWDRTGVPPGDRYVLGNDAEIRVEPGNAAARVNYPGTSDRVGGRTRPHHLRGPPQRGLGRRRPPGHGRDRPQ